MKIVFMGTPDYAAGSLDGLVKAGHEITLVITQPDRPKGRSGEPVPSPVKVYALEHGLPVWQPEKIKRPEAVEHLRGVEADLFVVAAFGQILSSEILSMPRYGCINVHASLLPKYRGASPIQRCILDGEEETGVTIMQMDEGIDTGDILYVRKTPIEKTDTFETLHDKLMVLGGEAIAEAVSLLERGELKPVKQDDALSCYAPLIRKEDGKLDLSKSAAEADRKVRAMNPWPGAFTFLNGKMLKIWKAEGFNEDEKAGRKKGAGKEASTVCEIGKEYFDIECGTGILRVYEVQLEGKKRMNCGDFLRGAGLKEGDTLG